jgi:8-oxo-dGTP diphosphatase
MSVLLVRHAKAADRDGWEGPDDMRPLTGKGQRQAEGLVATLADFDVVRILSSPYLRCTQTVAPLAAARRLPVEPCDDLAEGAGHAALALVRGLVSAPRDIVLCTHGDVVEEVLDGLGVRRSGWTAKGATWVLGDEQARCLPPPA